MKKVAIYARVSTDKQTTQNQIDALREVAERCGYQITQIFSEDGISGSKGREGRPALDQLMKSLQAMKIDLFFLQQGMDTTTPSGRMIFSVFGAIGEFERNLIRERVIAGQKRAVANGVKMGRPSKMNDGMRSAIKLLRDKGMGIKQISKQLQIGIGTVYSVL